MSLLSHGDQLAALAVLKERAKTHKEARKISAMMREALAQYDTDEHDCGEDTCVCLDPD